MTNCPCSWQGEGLVPWWRDPLYPGLFSLQYIFLLFTEHKLLQPKGEGEDDPTCSGMISEVLVTGHSVRDMTRHYQCGAGKRELPRSLTNRLLMLPGTEIGNPYSSSRGKLKEEWGRLIDMDTSGDPAIIAGPAVFP